MVVIDKNMLIVNKLKNARHTKAFDIKIILIYDKNYTDILLNI